MKTSPEPSSNELTSNELTSKVPTNTLAARSPGGHRELLHALRAVRDGDFSVRLPGEWTGIQGKVADTFNQIVTSNARMASELKRIGHLVGRQGQTRHRVKFGQSSGAWGEMEGSVNTLIEDLLWPTTDVTGALAAVAQGDLSRSVRLEVDGRPLEGEFLRSATIVNTMIRQLGVFTSEVTRVARESAPTASLAVRRRFARSAACGRTSPRASTRWRAT